MASDSDPVTAIRQLLVIPVALLYRLARDQKATIDADVSKWAERNKLEPRATTDLLPRLLVCWPEFRNVFYYRLEGENRQLKIAVKVARRLLRPLGFLDISTPDIGPGLVLAHGFGTILNANRIGKNCWIHHQVTIGWDYSSHAGRPTIGDNVFIGTGAKILGAITVGDGARIGANAVVISDVPPGATAVGVPAAMIERKPR